MDYKPGDIVHIKREIGSDRYFFIEGTCLGGEGQRDVVAVIFADDRNPPSCEGSDGAFKHREVHHVPISLFEAALEYQKTEIYERFEEMENPVYE